MKAEQGLAKSKEQGAKNMCKSEEGPAKSGHDELCSHNLFKNENGHAKN